MQANKYVLIGLILMTSLNLASASIDGNWLQGDTIVIDSAYVYDDLINFPVVLRNSSLPSEMFDNENGAASDGCDIRFTSDDVGSLEVPFEIVDFNKTSGTAEIWVKLNLTGDTDTLFYIWYNNSAATCYDTNDTYGSENVWNSDYVLVQHHNENPEASTPEFKDSTDGSHDGTGAAGMTEADLLAAKIGDGLEFDGAATELYTIANHADFDFGAGDFTISFWAKQISYNALGGLLWRSPPSGYAPFTILDADTYLAFYASTGASSWNIASAKSIGTFDSNLAYYTVTRHGTVFNTTRNGVMVSTWTDPDTIGAGTGLYVGQYSLWYANFVMDELQMWKGNYKTPEWILTEYANQNDVVIFAYSGGVDTTAPTYAQPQYSSTAKELPCTFKLTITDDVSLTPNGQYLFSHNNSGTWHNLTPVNFTSNPELAEATITLNSTLGTNVCFKWFLTDNIGNQNITNTDCLVTTQFVATEIEYINSSTGVNLTYAFPFNWSVDDVIIDKPGGLIEGDFMLAQIAVYNDVETITAPYGWDELFQIQEATGLDHTTGVFYKFVNNSEGDSYNFTKTGTQTSMSGSITAYRGVNTVQPFDIPYYTPDHYLAYDVSVGLSPDITTITDNAMVVIGSTNSVGSATTVADPEYYNMRVDMAGADYNKVHQALSDRLISEYGLVEPGQWVWSLGDLSNWVVALRGPESTRISFANHSISNNQTGKSTTFSILVNTTDVLHPKGQYIFSTNNTGSWVNDSAINFTTTPQWANVTKTLNSTLGTEVCYIWYSTDNFTTEFVPSSPPITVDDYGIGENLIMENFWEDDWDNTWDNISTGGAITFDGNIDYQYIILTSSAGGYSAIEKNFTVSATDNWIVEFDLIYAGLGTIEILNSTGDAVMTLDLDASTDLVNFTTDVGDTWYNASFANNEGAQTILSYDATDHNISYYSRQARVGQSLAMTPDTQYTLRFKADVGATNNVRFTNLHVYKPQLISIGASITQGMPVWSNLLGTGTEWIYRVNPTGTIQYRTGEKFTDTYIGNRAFGGSALSQALSGGYLTYLLEQNPTKVYLSYGHNDLALYGQSVAAIQTNFNTAIAQIQAAGINGTNIIIGNIVPTSWLPTDGETEDADHLNEWFYNRSLEEGFLYFDLYNLVVDPSDPDDLNPAYDSGDHTHWNSAGYQLAADALDDLLRSTNMSSQYYCVTTLAQADIAVPTYSLNDTNTTIAGASIQFSLKVDDDTALEPNGQYIFSTNNTGNWNNDSAVNFTSTPNWANVTKTLNSTVGISIGFMWYLSDNVSNSTSTPVYSLTTSTLDITPPSLDWNWTAINTSVSSSDVYNVCINASEAVNCSLNFGGTVWVNGTSSTDICFFNTTIADNNYTVFAECSDTSANSANTTDAWYTIDTTGPTLLWNWTDINSTITTTNITKICVNSTETINCTLNLNGTSYQNITSGTTVCWTRELSNGNYSTINATCEDTLTNPTTTSNAWINVSAPSDSTPPVINWTWNYNVNTTSNRTNLNISIEANENLDACTIQLGSDNYSMTSDTATTYHYDWNITTEANYTIEVRCNDTALNEGNNTGEWYRYANLTGSPDIIFTVPATANVETNFAVTNTITTNGLLINYTSNISDNCIYISGDANYTNTTYGGTALVTTANFQCHTAGTYPFTLNITYTNNSGTFVENATGSILIVVPTGPGGGGGTGTELPLYFNITPSILTPRNDVVAQKTAYFNFDISNGGRAFNGDIQFELLKTKELGTNEFATDGWCYLEDDDYSDYLYRTGDNVENIPLRCNIPDTLIINYGEKWIERVCMVPDIDTTSKNCSLIEISFDKKTIEEETKSLVETIQTIILSNILLITIIIAFTSLVAIMYKRNKSEIK